VLCIYILLYLDVTGPFDGKLPIQFLYYILCYLVLYKFFCNFVFVLFDCKHHMGLVGRSATNEAQWLEHGV